MTCKLSSHDTSNKDRSIAKWTEEYHSLRVEAAMSSGGTAEDTSVPPARRQQSCWGGCCPLISFRLLQNLTSPIALLIRRSVTVIFQAVLITLLQRLPFPGVDILWHLCKNKSSAKNFLLWLIQLDRFLNLSCFYGRVLRRFYNLTTEASMSLVTRCGTKPCLHCISMSYYSY